MNLAIVTGASRGLGRALSVAFAEKFSPCELILFSRNLDGLKETEKEVVQIASTASCSSYSVDFSDLDHLDAELDGIIREVDITKYKTVFLFNNHGTLGPIVSIRETKDIQALRKELDLNITSVMITNVVFLKYFETKVKEVVIVNMSSLAAVKPFHSMSTYNITRAGKAMLHSVLSEEVQGQNVKVLNYQPGPCDTDMSKELRECGHAATRDYFSTMHKEGKLVDPYTSTRKLMDILHSNSYVSGSSIDYYDVQ